tara:strand:- start:147 stop:1040 length:894 start_codon:yes stop_codon:yes gene_type:complete
MKKKTLLTIDWDAFIPEPIEADLGHNESLLYREILWGHRGYLEPIMQLSKFANGFFDGMDLSRVPIYISDSHMEAFSVMWPDTSLPPEGEWKVALVDQHHDMWPSNEDRVCCATWLTQAIEVGMVREVDWYCPSFSHCVPTKGTGDEDMLRPLLNDHGVDMSVRSMDEWEENRCKLQPDAIHICRSSCWTPPWLDRDFQQFCLSAAFGQGERQITTLGEWNPVDVRPSPVDGNDAHEEVLRSMIPDREKGLEALVSKCLEWVKECGEHPHLFEDPARRVSVMAGECSRLDYKGVMAI